ncbi:multiprotein bridging factor type 1 [Reticulomyxa filosa]|uniref:Multiprotein bridging factor type 1 n=1 Tax=Reticulomyxa filosa TaxID=46433 RepID=X6MEX6_RETFI|nr:multiprotein bridging factor type 1 [Reticulomyxa filosa]|eukprot:ETO11957.1 multiprotein bridging factor type 1 [Reticulomyxa filosa]
MSMQDWKEITVYKSKPVSQNRGRGRGRGQGGQNSQGQGGDGKPKARKSKMQKGKKVMLKNYNIFCHFVVEEEMTDFHVQSVGLSFGKSLQQARQKKGWDQKTLAQHLNVKASIIGDYENGRAKPDSQLISRMNRILGCKLPPATKK